MPARASCTRLPATARTTTTPSSSTAPCSRPAARREVPHTVSPDSSYFPDVPFFAGERIYDDKGKDGGANEAVIKKLVEVGALIARGRLKHQYPHSWRSKAPLLFRNTPQWFIAMDKPLDDKGDTLRQRALHAHQDRRVGAGDRREPHHRHDREPARLGGLAPARLGRADRRLRARRAPTRSSRTSASTRPSPTPSRRKARMPGIADDGARFLAGRRPRRRAISRRSTTSSTSGSIPAARTPSRSRSATT